MIRLIVVYGTLAVLGLFAAAYGYTAWNERKYRPLDIGEPPESEAYIRFAERTGRIPSCDGHPGGRKYIALGAGGDRMFLSTGRFVIYDERDTSIGELPTMREHDTLVFRRKVRSGMSFRKAGQHLLICGNGLDLTILRFFCRNPVEGRQWNNGIEEITFGNGETFLSPHLYEIHTEDPELLDLGYRLRKIYELESVSDTELARWRVASLSKILPGDFLAPVACYYENETLGLLPESTKNPVRD